MHDGSGFRLLRGLCRPQIHRRTEIALVRTDSASSIAASVTLQRFVIVGLKKKKKTGWTTNALTASVRPEFLARRYVLCFGASYEKRNMDSPECVYTFAQVVNALQRLRKNAQMSLKIESGVVVPQCVFCAEVLTQSQRSPQRRNDCGRYYLTVQTTDNVP